MSFIRNLYPTLKRFISSFIKFTGVLGIFLGILDISYRNKFNFGFWFPILMVISFIYAFYSIRRKLQISRFLSTSSTRITIKVGDLFAENDDTVIGMNDVFDTEKGSIIKPTSIQGQFLTKIYNDDRGRLDSDIDNALHGVTGHVDHQKTLGKKKRYPIGTVATLSVGPRKFYCSAYSRMGVDCKAQSDVRKLQTSLDLLWEAIRLHGQRGRVVMAVLGSDLARIGVASHSNLIKLITASFILASRESPITEELTIIIHKSNLGKFNMFELDDFLQNF